MSRSSVEVTAEHEVNPDATLTGARKSRYVQGMFGRIAARYDFMNALMSFGQDAKWRRLTACEAAPAYGALALDVATGTGMIARELSWIGARVIALDFTIPMMLEGRARGIGANGRVSFVGGDAMQLPFGDNTFDCVTTGFAMRNVVDIEGAFREMRRVLKPGGRLVCLEVGHPRTPEARLFHHIYTGSIVPRLGKQIAGDADAYSYLPSSMGKFPPPDELARIMVKAGLRKVQYRQLTFGAAAIHRAVK